LMSVAATNALLREQVRGRAAHAAGRTSDQHRAILNRAAEVFVWFQFDFS
jgi:hypothetical protein